jgi:hypothetical protein
MAIKSNFVKRNVPNVGTRKSAPTTTNFAKGVATYKPNDMMGTDELRLAQDARFDRVGEYATRSGLKALSSNIIGLQAIGTLAPSFAPNFVTTYAQEITIESDARICGYRTNVMLSSTATETPVAKFILYINDEKADEVCINPDDVTTSSQQFDLLFNSAPDVVEGDVVKIVYTLQTGNNEPSPNYVMISANQVADGKYRPGGQLLTCTAGGIDSIFEANIDGAKTVLFTQNGILYRMAENGTMTAVRTLPTGAGTVRYSQNLNQIRYADGAESPRLLDPDNGNWTDTKIDTLDLATDTDLQITPTNIMNGPSDNLIYFASEPDTEAVWTYPYGYTYAKSPAFSTTATIEGNIGDTLTINSSTITPSGFAIGDWITGQGTGTGEITAISGGDVTVTIVDTTPQTISSYDKFNVDFYQNFPAIKTGDPLTAMFNLAGVLYFQTRRNKYLMYMQSADSWSQQASNAQGGTFSQESVVCDLNYAYYANDNGIYIFDGSSEQSLTQNTIQNAYDAIPNKETIRLDLYKNRLYVFFSNNGAELNSCFVYNINLRVWESFDSNTYVGATSARQNASGRFLCGHSRIGLIMTNEDGDYSNLGQPIAFNLETAYQHYGSTSQLKRITKWRPEFATTERAYTVECGYSQDFSDQVKYAFSIDLQRQVPVITDYVWDNPSDYGVPAIPTVHTTTPKVNGEFYRCQIRYQHIAAFEPVIFRSHTLTIQTQRIR